MRHRILGLGSTLAFLFIVYAVLWLFDPNEISYVAGKPDSVERIFKALTLALIFTSSVLFILVWPQTLLACWIVKRFQVHHLLPFALFFVLSSIVVCIIVFLACSSERFLPYLAGMSYLFVACSILWRISFGADRKQDA
jgi:hypothetical protein